MKSKTHKGKKEGQLTSLFACDRVAMFIYVVLNFKPMRVLYRVLSQAVPCLKTFLMDMWCCYQHTGRKILFEVFLCKLISAF